MKRIFSILFAVVLALSLTLVPAAPAMAQPNEVWVDDDFTGATPGWGTTHFDKIQDGIDAVAEDGTVYVAAGEYYGSGYTTRYQIIKIQKSLTLLGAQADVPIVNGERAGDESIIRGKGTGVPSWKPSSWCVIRIKHSDVVVNGFTIENGKRGIAIQGIGPDGISNIRVSYNHIEGSGYAGIFRDTAAADVTIDHNYIAFNPRGIATNGGATTITDNTFYGNGKGIDFNGGDPYSIYFPDYDQPNYPSIISGNAFTNDRTSIKLSLRGHQSITVTGNDITEARTVAIETSGWYTGDLVNPAIHYNNISNNEFGINNQAAEITLDAEKNWWGDCSGPSGAGSGSGDAVSANVLFDPWLGQQLCALKVAIAGLPDSAFKKQNAAGDQRQALIDKIDAVFDQYDDCAHRGAKNKLERDIAKRIEKWIEEDAITNWGLIAKVDAEIDILEGFLP